MGKVNKFGCRLPIHSQTAELIREQQAAIRARFSDTPVAELVLFPALQRHRNGRRPFGAHTWSSELRAWADPLEPRPKRSPSRDPGRRRTAHRAPPGRRPGQGRRGPSRS
jgi:hypothetical protein